MLECDNSRCVVLCLLSERRRSVKPGDAANVSSANLKVEALKPLRFDGDIRMYPDFKDDFMSIIVAKYGKNLFALRQCLGGKPLKVVTGYEKDFEEMKFLDKEYGDPRKLVDLVISDLKALRKVPDRDDRGFMDMIDVVERCYLDLQRVSLEGEIDSKYRQHDQNAFAQNSKEGMDFTD